MAYPPPGGYYNSPPQFGFPEPSSSCGSPPLNPYGAQLAPPPGPPMFPQAGPGFQSGHPYPPSGPPAGQFPSPYGSSYGPPPVPPYPAQYGNPQQYPTSYSPYPPPNPPYGYNSRFNGQPQYTAPSYPSQYPGGPQLSPPMINPQGGIPPPPPFANPPPPLNPHQSPPQFGASALPPLGSPLLGPSETTPSLPPPLPPPPPPSYVGICSPPSEYGSRSVLATSPIPTFNSLSSESSPPPLPAKPLEHRRSPLAPSVQLPASSSVAPLRLGSKREPTAASSDAASSSTIPSIAPLRIGTPKSKPEVLNTPSITPMRTTLPHWQEGPTLSPLRVGSMRSPSKPDIQATTSFSRSQSVRDTASTKSPMTRTGISPPIRDIPLPMGPPSPLPGPSEPTLPSGVTTLPSIAQKLDFTKPLTYLGVDVPAISGPPPEPTSFNPLAGVEILQKALTGQLDAGAVINTLTTLSPIEIEALCRLYKETTGKALEDVIGETAKSWLRMGLRGLALGPIPWDVELIQQATADPTGYEDLLVEILFGRTNEEILALKAAYEMKYIMPLEERVRRVMPGSTLPMLGIVLAGIRESEDAPVDHLQVVEDTISLYEAGEAKKNVDEDRFVAILCRRSNRHLSAVGEEYSRRYDSSLTKAVKKELSGFTSNALLAVVKATEGDGQGHGRYAELLEAAMAGWGTRDERLVWRVIRAHWERQRMEAIKEAFLRQQKQSLAARVKGETSGDYRVFLLALIGWSLRSESSIIM